MKMRSRVLAAVLAFGAAACSSESAAPTGDASSLDAVADASADAPTFLDSTIGDVTVSTDVSVDPLDDHTSFNDCTPYDFTVNDHTAPADPRLITFPYDPAPMQYAPRCMMIKAGQTVTWHGAFQYHPLVAAGGDVPSPITTDPMPSGTERMVTFPNAGFFGFECATHEAPMMYGALFVVP